MLREGKWFPNFACLGQHNPYEQQNLMFLPKREEDVTSNITLGKDSLHLEGIHHIQKVVVNHNIVHEYLHKF